MSLIKFHSPSSLNSFNSLVDEFFGTPRVENVDSNYRHSIPVNIHESENSIQLELSVPGFLKEEIEVELKENQLIIKGTHEEKAEKVKTVKKEFHYNSFKRSFTIPKNIDREQIEAGQENGILSIQLPKLKKEAAELLKKIAIK